MPSVKTSLVLQTYEPGTAVDPDKHYCSYNLDLQPCNLKLPTANSPVSRKEGNLGYFITYPATFYLWTPT